MCGAKKMGMVLGIEHGSKKILVLRKINCVAHGKNAPWEVGQKREYLEHTESDF
jgi:hypothetical protein